jgi:hypothetical protein
MKRNAMQSKHRQPPPKKETPCHSYKEGMEVKRRKELKFCNFLKKKQRKSSKERKKIHSTKRKKEIIILNK